MANLSMMESKGVKEQGKQNIKVSGLSNEQRKLPTMQLGGGDRDGGGIYRSNRVTLHLRICPLSYLALV